MKRKIELFLTADQCLIKLYQRIITAAIQKIVHLLYPDFSFDVFTEKLWRNIVSSQDAAVFRVTISYNFHQMWKKAADVVLNKIANRRIASAERIPDEFYSVEYFRVFLP